MVDSPFCENVVYVGDVPDPLNTPFLELFPSASVHVETVAPLESPKIDASYQYRLGSGTGLVENVQYANGNLAYAEESRTKKRKTMRRIS